MLTSFPRGPAFDTTTRPAGSVLVAGIFLAAGYFWLREEVA